MHLQTPAVTRSGYETRSLLRDEVLPKLAGDLEKLSRAFAAKKVIHSFMSS